VHPALAKADLLRAIAVDMAGAFPSYGMIEVMIAMRVNGSRYGLIINISNIDN
jgi:hypothetical protein